MYKLRPFLALLAALVLCIALPLLAYASTGHDTSGAAQGDGTQQADGTAPDKEGLPAVQNYVERRPVCTYTVWFDSRGGNYVAPVMDILPGTTIAEPQPPEREGYVFTGWYREAACRTPWRFATDAVTCNRTLYAGWTPAEEPQVVLYTVTFDSRGGSYVPPVTEVPAGSTVAQPAGPSRPDYVFTGWYRETACQTPWNFAQDTVHADLTLYAGWKPRTVTGRPYTPEASGDRSYDTPRSTAAADAPSVEEKNETPPPVAWGDNDVPLTGTAPVLPGLLSGGALLLAAAGGLCGKGKKR